MKEKGDREDGRRNKEEGERKESERDTQREKYNP